jgi:hypothetical protein
MDNSTWWRRSISLNTPSTCTTTAPRQSPLAHGADARVVGHHDATDAHILILYFKRTCRYSCHGTPRWLCMACFPNTSTACWLLAWLSPVKNDSKAWLACRPNVARRSPDHPHGSLHHNHAYSRLHKQAVPNAGRKQGGGQHTHRCHHKLVPPTTSSPEPGKPHKQPILTHRSR